MRWKTERLSIAKDREDSFWKKIEHGVINLKPQVKQVFNFPLLGQVPATTAKEKKFFQFMVSGVQSTVA